MNVGLRETKKLQTRQTIAETAMGLFAKRGFDHVTVAEIASAAGVSEKTVFNYFPTKEDLFFDEVPARAQALAAAVRGRRPGDSVVAALRRLHAEHVSRFGDPGFATFARIIEDSPALQAKELAVMAFFMDVLAAAIRDELGVHEHDAKVAANALIGIQWQLFRDARAEALAGRHGRAAVRRLRSHLQRAYSLLERGLGELERAGSAS